MCILHLRLRSALLHKWPWVPRFRGMSKKHRYKIRNWNAYNRALINRGSLTLWIDEEAAHTQWGNHEKNGRRGRDLTYSD
jgi:hypothetical protein